jgi:hypothetical protein
MDVRTCVIYEAPFGNEPGHEVALFEEEFGAQELKQELEEIGFQARVHPGKESARRFWYLKTNADFDTLWSVLGCTFAAYLRFQITPQGRLERTESCGCANCREPFGPDAPDLMESLEFDHEAPCDGDGPRPDRGFGDPRWN